MNGLQFRITATKEQLEQLERMCQVTELLMASTLAKRIEGMKAEQAEEYIISWFQSVRHMAHGAWISCNIQAQAGPIGVPLPGSKAELMARINKALQGVGHTMNAEQLKAVQDAL